MELFCIQCNQDSEVSKVTGREVYSHRPDLYNKNFYRCNKCKNFVGCHNQGKSTRPLGCIPNKAMKNARQHIHTILDPIWKNRSANYKSRSQVYREISEAVGYEFHTAELRSIDEARKIYMIVKKISARATLHDIRKSE